MHVLSEGDVDGEGQDDGKVGPPENPLQGVGGTGAQTPISEQVAQCAADGNVGFGAGPALGYPESMGQQGGQHQPADEDNDDQGVGVAGEVVTEPVGFEHPSADECPDQDGEHHGSQDVQIAAVNPDACLGEQPFWESMPR